MDAVSLAPAAGAQGELCGILMIKAYLARPAANGHRRKVLVPDSAHGTNPATAAMAGFEVVAVPLGRRRRHGPRRSSRPPSTTRRRGADAHAARARSASSTRTSRSIAEMLHDHGALLYGDGANLNAFLGQRAASATWASTSMHINLHKTFSTPHGGGGPGAGPVCVKANLAPLPPGPIVERAPVSTRSGTRGGSERSATLRYDRPPISPSARPWPSTATSASSSAPTPTSAVLGGEGLRAMSENAVRERELRPRARCADAYELPYDRTCMHEVVFSGGKQQKRRAA